MNLLKQITTDFLHTVRGRLIFGLLPGFAALITLLLVGLLATDILVQANSHLAEAGWELAATRSLQLSLEQTMNAYDAVRHDQDPTAIARFRRLAAHFERELDEAQPHYGESEEQVLMQDVQEQWHRLYSSTESLLGSTQIAQSAVIEQRIDEQAATISSRLDDLYEVVYTEMEKTVAAGKKAHDTASTLLIGSILIAFMFGLLFVWLFSDYLTRPLVALREGATRIGEGNLSYRLDISRRDEVGDLARAFNLMAERLRESYQHLEERVAERTAQLWALNQASQSVVGELRIDRVLQTIADLALRLGDAEYAAVLVPRKDAASPPRFIVAPANMKEELGNMAWPLGKGLLGWLMQAEHPLRIDDLAQHPRAAGFPEAHPEMRSFLGIPIRVHGRTIGGLYLTNKRGGTTFSEEDEQLLLMLAAYAGIAIENARLYQELTKMNEDLEARVAERTAELHAVSAERAEYAATLRQVLNRNVQIQEEERKRIAKGIHDGVSQWLMGALFELQAARVRLPAAAGDARQHLEEAQRVLREVKEEMRRVIYDLHPPLLESNGLATAIRNYIQELEAHSHLDLSFTVDGQPRRLPADQELALFRIGQEALANVIKHAESTNASVLLQYTADEVCLCVIDSGRGFDMALSQSSTRSQLGLLSMSERAAAVGARLEIVSQPNQGTRVQVTVPLRSQISATSQQREAISS